MEQKAAKLRGSHIFYRIYIYRRSTNPPAQGGGGGGGGGIGGSENKNKKDNTTKGHYIRWSIATWYKQLLWECNISLQQ